MDECFNVADIGVCSLGCHRKGLYGKTSELKSREYLSRGLPIVSSTGIDVVPEDSSYFLKVSEDENPIEINAIVEFFEHVYQNKNRDIVIKEIRSFAENRCSWEFGMKEIGKFL